MSSANCRRPDYSSDDDTKLPPAKRCKADGPLSLNFDAISLVLELLPPTDLYNAALTCKALRVKITVGMVVKSVLIQNGRGKQTLDELHKLMSRKAIHPPSALRLLRLVNGRRCELCNRGKVKFIRPGIGIFSCWTCLTERGLTKAWKLTWVRYRKNVGAYERVFKHPRTAAQEYSKTNYMMHVPRTDKAGESIGPVVCFDDIDKMVAHEDGVDDYLDTVLGAPSEDEHAEFNSAYTGTLLRAQRVAQERIEKYREENQKKKDGKKAKVEKIISNLSDLLDESFRDAALKRKDLTNNRYSSSSKQPCLQFLVPFVDGVLKEYVLAPSKMRKKNMQEIADKINTKLRLIDDKNFLSLDYLSEDEPFEVVLKNHFSGDDKISDLDALFSTKIVRTSWRSTGTCPIDDAFFDLIESDKLISALVHLKGSDFMSSFLLPQGAVAQDQERLKALAKNIWVDKLKQEDQADDQRFGRAFTASQTALGDARLAIEAYTVWLQEKYPGENHLDRRDRARDSAFRDSLDLPLLLSRNFVELDERHGRYHHLWF